jgi:hypothetical protein
MHCRREVNTIEECSFAPGRRKATFAGAGPQLSMFPWFQRSTQVRRACETVPLDFVSRGIAGTEPLARVFVLSALTLGFEPSHAATKSRDVRRIPLVNLTFMPLGP